LSEREEARGRLCLSPSPRSLSFLSTHLRHGRSASRALLDDTACCELAEGEGGEDGEAEEDAEASGRSGSRGGGGGLGGGEEAGDGLSVAGAACSCLSATELLLPPFAGAARATCRGRVTGFPRTRHGLACAAGKGRRRSIVGGGIENACLIDLKESESFDRCFTPFLRRIRLFVRLLSVAVKSEALQKQRKRQRGRDTGKQRAENGVVLLICFLLFVFSFLSFFLTVASLLSLFLFLQSKRSPPALARRH